MAELVGDPTPIIEIEAVGKFVGSIPVSILPPGMTLVEMPIEGVGFVKPEMLISTGDVGIVVPPGKLIDGEYGIAVMPSKVQLPV